MRFSRGSPLSFSMPLTLVRSSWTGRVSTNDALMTSSSMVAAMHRRRSETDRSPPVPMHDDWLASAEIPARHGQGHARDVRGLIRGEKQDCRNLLLGGA